MPKYGLSVIRILSLTRIGFCPNTGKYCSEKVRICAYFMQYYSGVSIADFEKVIVTREVNFTICGYWLIQNLDKRKKRNKFKRFQIEMFFLPNISTPSPEYNPIKCSLCPYISPVHINTIFQNMLIDILILIFNKFSLLKNVVETFQHKAVGNIAEKHCMKRFLVNNIMLTFVIQAKFKQWYELKDIK